MTRKMSEHVCGVINRSLQLANYKKETKKIYSHKAKQTILFLLFFPPKSQKSLE